jgi:hypothetical protein
MPGGEQSADAAAPDGAALNNAPDESFTNTEPQSDAPVADEPANESTTAALAGDAAATPSPEALTADSQTAPAVQAAASTQVATPSAATGPQPGGMVRYVSTSGVSTYASTTDKSVVSTLEQGDHPLVYEEGEWARTADGKYVPANALVTQPVGRMKSPKSWK